MATLRIEHAISDFAIWKTAFDRFASKRERAGVRHHRIYCAADDPGYVLIDLDFDDARAAGDFLDFLQRVVWSSPETSPALVGSPRTRILKTMETTEGQESIS